MAASPRLKVYSADGQYLASFKYAEDAACLVAMRGNASTIREGHSTVVWLEGVDGIAAESYDALAEVVYHRAPLSIPR